MSISLINAISPTLVWLSIIVPILAGIAGKQISFSVTRGWLLCVLAFIFQDLINVVLAAYFHGEEGVEAVAIDTPGTCLAVAIGWFIPLLGHYLGYGTRKFLMFSLGIKQPPAEGMHEIHSQKINNKRWTALRVSLLLLALFSGVFVAHFAMWQGLGGESSLSSSNSEFAIRIGFAYGGILLLIVNYHPFSDRIRILKFAAGLLITFHILFGLLMMIWVASRADV